MSRLRNRIWPIHQKSRLKTEVTGTPTMPELITALDGQKSEDRSLAPTPVVGGESQKFEEGLR